MVTAMSGANSNFREDELQSESCDQIIQLLVAAGYFRARIKGLSNFDKVVGGLVWCIQVCSVDIEVELLFNENWNIGRKIALTEKIVKALKDMKCPHPIEPHQIQGNDYVHVFPVVQWLVKRALETREQTAQYHADFAIYQLEKSFGIVRTQAKSIKVYKPIRAYRHNAPESLNPDMLVEAVIMEYSTQKAVEETGQSSSILNDMRFVEGEVISPAENERMKEIVERRKKEVEDGVEEWKQLRGDEEDVSVKKESTLKHIQFSEKRLDELRERIRNRTEEVRLGRIRMDEAKVELESLQNINNRVEGFDKVCDMLNVLDEMKKQEQEFKKECRNELEKLQKMVEDEEKQAAGELEEGELDVKVDAEFSHVAQMKIKIAKLNRQVGKLQRAIDQVPTRSELGQFQRRFVELHQQVADVHKETKQYYTMYNTMNDLCAYLDKEIGLVNSIQDNFAQAMGSSSGRDMFFKQVEASVQGIKANRVKTERRRLDAKMERDKLQHEYLKLVDKQRVYVKLVAEFKEELKRNQLLMASKVQHQQSQSIDDDDSDD